MCKDSIKSISVNGIICQDGYKECFSGVLAMGNKYTELQEVVIITLFIRIKNKFRNCVEHMLEGKQFKSKPKLTEKQKNNVWNILESIFKLANVILKLL